VSNAPLKRLVSCVRQPSAAHLPYVGLEHVGSGTGRLLTDSITEPIEAASALDFQAGDVLFGKLRPYLAKSFLAEVRGCCSSEFLVLRTKSQLEQRFLSYVVQSQPFTEWANATSDGAKMPRSDWEAIAAFDTWFPSCEGQREIADLLDAQTGLIDDLIDRKRRLIELLDERWQFELSATFASRDMQPFKRLLKERLAYGVLVPQPSGPDGVPMLRITDLASGSVDLGSVARIPSSQSSEYQRTVVRTRDIVVSVVGTLGRAMEIPPELDGCNLNRALARVQLRDEVPRSLIRFWFESQAFQAQAMRATDSDSAQRTLGLGDLQNFSVRIPSNPSSWTDISKYLSDRGELMNKAKACLGRQIDLLRIRRQALIAAAVTGQIQIPGAA